MTNADPLAGTGIPYATRDGAVAWMTIMGVPQSRDNVDQYDSLAALASAPADEAWVYACVSKRFKAAVSVPLVVYVRDGKSLTPAYESGVGMATDLQFVLDNVNGLDMTGTEFRGYTQASRAVWGGCGWKKVRGGISGRTRELYWLRAPDLKPKSANGRWVDTWEYRPQNGTPESLPREDVLTFRNLNMGNQIDFLSPLSSARHDIATNRAAALHTAATLQNRGVPEGYWMAQKGVEIGRQDQSAIRRFIRQLRGPKNAGKSLISPDIEYKAIGLNPKDAEWIAARKISRMMVSAVLGVPLLVAGDDDKASVYANYRDADVAFWRGTMVDELNSDADVLNNWLVPEFDPTRRLLVVSPDFSKVEALKPTYQDQVTAWGSFIDRQAAVPNELRAYFNLGQPLPWGDRPTPKTQITLRPDPATIALNLPVEEGIEAEVDMGEVATGGAPGDASDIAGALRAWGRNLYRHPAVRAFVAHGGPLDADQLAGIPVPEPIRQQIEDGLRRRHSAATIAASLEGE